MNNELPNLVVCKGCNKNIKKKMDGKSECWIHINNIKSRHLEYRKENNLEGKILKPYKTYIDIKERNNLVKFLKKIKRN
jgi:hypothetical protein